MVPHVPRVSSQNARTNPNSAQARPHVLVLRHLNTMPHFNPGQIICVVRPDSEPSLLPLGTFYRVRSMSRLFRGLVDVEHPLGTFAGAAFDTNRFRGATQAESKVFLSREENRTIFGYNLNSPPPTNHRIGVPKGKLP